MSPKTLPRLTTRAALYLRLSVADLKPGESVSDGINRQRSDVLEVARHRHGLRPDARLALHSDPDADKADVVLYVEDGESAWKKKRVWITDQYGERRRAYRNVRPIWGQMMRDIRSRKFRLAVIYNSDRLARDLYDIEDVIETAQYFGQTWDAASGSFDLSTEDGRTMARMMAIINQKASADTSRRVQRKHQDKAEKGEPTGGNRPFGWKPDRATLDPVESRQIRRAVDRIRAGMAPTAVLKEWSEKGILTSCGNVWQWAPFMSMLRNPRLCGYRGRHVIAEREDGTYSYSWEIVTLANGTEVKGQWKAVISRAEWDDLIVKIGDRSRPSTETGGGGVAKYLLSGMVRCGKCGGRMNGNRMLGNGTEYFYYLCPIKRQGGCGSNGRSMPKVDVLIEALALELHAEGSLDDEVDPGEIDADAEIERINRRLDEAYAEWKAERLPASGYFAMRADLEKDQAVYERMRQQAASATVASELDEIARRWAKATVDERRAFVRAYVSAVVIHGIEDVWDERKGRMVHPTRFNAALIEPVLVKRQRALAAVAS
jgi:Site-specific recombinases, DNA invertase Pin homologs